jgi:PAS domain S-box-containing protein
VQIEEKFPGLDATLGMGLLAASPDCVKLLELDGSLRFVNPSGLCLLEIDDAAVVDGRKLPDMWPEAMADNIRMALERANSGKIGTFSGFCPTAKGTPKWWDVAISPVYDSANKLVWLLSVSRDTTKEKSAELALLISEQKFRALADNIAQFAWMADASGNIFWYNQRWFDYTGTQLKDMLGWGWKSVHHPDHVERVVEKISSCFASGTIWEDTFPLRSADGDYRWFLSRAMPIHDEHGNVSLWCGTNTDITDQRNASQRLRQLARLIELSHEAIMVRGLTSGILLWNRGCEDLYGYTQAEAVGSQSHNLLHTENVLSAEQMETLLKSEGTWSGELVRTTKDGTRVVVDCRKQVIRVGDDYVVLESDRDITERRKSEEVRNLLVAELNHRVKNTLAIVQSLASQTARSSRSMGDFVCNFSGRLQSLSSTHNVLTETNWSGAPLGELIKSQVEFAATNMQRFKLGGQDVFIPQQAALQLTLILHELVTNAVKHGSLANATGEVSISWVVPIETPTDLQITWQETGGAAVCAPKSSGFGMSLIEKSGRLPHLSTEVTFGELGLICKIQVKLDEQPTGNPVKYFNPAKAKAHVTNAK